MQVDLIILLIIFGIFLIFFLFLEPIFSKHKIKNGNEYGSARFATFNEIKEKFNKEEISNIIDSGFPIWFSKDIKYVWFDRETPHYVYLGSSGSGKSVTCVIPNCSFIATAQNKRSVFITDPKGEIFSTTSKMFKNNGYDILTIDFRNPELSNKINLLEPIIREYEEHIEYDKLVDKTNSDINCLCTSIESFKSRIKETTGERRIKHKKEQLYNKEKELKQLEDELLKYRNTSMRHFAECNRLITSLATMIMHNEKAQEKDPFWNNSARNLLEGLIGFYLEEYRKGKIKREQITLNSIKKFQNSSMDDDNFETLKTYVDSKPYGVKSKDSLTSIFSASENTYKSITATFGEKMALFDDVNVANITSSSDFDFDVLGKKPTAIYIIVPDEDKTYYNLITIIVGLLYRELVKLANSQEDKSLPVKIDWMLDEFANCPPLSDIEAIVSVARSRGMRFHFFIQSLSQLDNVYGKEVAQIILDNCGLIYLKTNTQDTAEAISKRLGKKTIESNSVSQSISRMDYNGNLQTGLMGRELLTPEEVKQLHHKTIIFPVRGFPIIRKTIIYKKFPCYEKGELKRIPSALEELSYTYYTVENICQSIKTEKARFTKESSNEAVNELYEDLRKEFAVIADKISQIIEGQKYEVNYPQENLNTYCEFVVDNILSGDDIDRIKKLCENKFHVEISNDNEKTIISIHRIISY